LSAFSSGLAKRVGYFFCTQEWYIVCIQETKIKLAAFSLRSRFQRLQESVAYPVGRQIIEQINCECSSKLPQYPWEARRRNRRTTEPFRMQAPEGGDLSAIVELSEAFYPQRSALIRFFCPSKSSIFRLRLVLTFCVLSQSFFRRISNALHT